MTNKRFNELMRNDNLELTPDELQAGWHFCCEWDGLLVSPPKSGDKYSEWGDCPEKCRCGWTIPKP